MSKVITSIYNNVQKKIRWGERGVGGKSDLYPRKHTHIHKPTFLVILQEGRDREGQK